jgi:hydrogenase expression/formation protein HypC
MTAFEVSSVAACSRDPHGCITCGDQATTMRVVAVDETRALALCETAAGERSTVEIALVDAAPGDEVLVHAGTAIA